MAATSPDATGPSGRGEESGGDRATGPGGPPPPAPPASRPPPPLGLDTAPLLAAVGLLDGDEDDDDLDTGDVVLREGEEG